MSDIEKKAQALLNEVLRDKGCSNEARRISRVYFVDEALCRAVEQHEAFRQEVSDAVEAYNDLWRKRTPGRDEFMGHFIRFIIAKPDPLAEAWIEATGNTVGMEPLNEAIQARGGKIVWEDE